MEVVKVNDEKVISTAIKVIKNGGVVICPTDTVYGFLADASNKKAVDKIYKIKKRAKLKPLPVFVRDLEMAKELAEINKDQEKVLKEYWFTRRSLGEGRPGKYTFVLNRKELWGVGDPTILWGINKKTIALRIPKYKFLNDLLKRINRPIVQTSVNISGQASLIKIDDIMKQFEKLDILVINGGNIKKNKSSKILDLTNDKIKVLRK